MWTNQVYGHHDKMARTKNTEHNKTRFFIFNFQLLKGLLTPIMYQNNQIRL